MPTIHTMTANEREQAFRKDLAELLSKHQAELEVTDDGKPHGMHHAICVITMTTEWDDNGIIAEHTSFRI